MEPNEQDLAYIAGFFDGEGSVSIRKAKPSVHHRTQSVRYSLLVSITNTNLPILEFIQSLLGGVIHERTWRTPMQRQSYSLYWSSGQGRRVLEFLSPYLRIKKGEAELGVAFQDVMDVSGGFGNKYYSNLSRLDLDVREVFYQMSRKMKEPIKVITEEKEE